MSVTTSEVPDKDPASAQETSGVDPQTVGSGMAENLVRFANGEKDDFSAYFVMTHEGHREAHDTFVALSLEAARQHGWKATPEKRPNVFVETPSCTVEKQVQAYDDGVVYGLLYRGKPVETSGPKRLKLATLFLRRSVEV